MYVCLFQIESVLLVQSFYYCLFHLKYFINNLLLIYLNLLQELVFLYHLLLVSCLT